ncbi:SPOR domain-containing protein [Novosphingobium sp. KCTC 2891]|uniref:SPOR domain-containing protein n=1 Tax=Novosphingobium sp. KCTC 2891 TaxID=2989730 RepID=UPI0022214AAB|nr:SPOR domain-containing protein [Novosphingobium sp. KCTC 2891]MCW1381233.1 SPOR domain-containing protein [Novosphingobium sp. KCTC 2891]
MVNGVNGASGAGNGLHNDWDEHLPEDEPLEAGPNAARPGDPTPFDEDHRASADRLALGDEERLPWLESADDVDLDEPLADNGRLVGFGVLAVILLAVIVGAIYWASHRASAPAQADGSLIEASKEPYKIAPKEPGGKTFQGTGDSSFTVSDGGRPVANIAGSTAPAPTPSAAPKPAPSASAAPAPAPAPSGIGVQIGAFSSSAAAEAAWSKLSTTHEALKGLNHRVVEGRADIGTVYRLQALAGDVGAANTLCGTLQSGGLKCQVKR